VVKGAHLADTHAQEKAFRLKVTKHVTLRRRLRSLLLKEGKNNGIKLNREL
jgi:hypothetical protein